MSSSERHGGAMTEVNVAGNLAAVRGAMAAAGQKAGRNAADITLVAISKIHQSDRIMPALDDGQRVFGENRVQEAAAKWPVLKERFPDIELHLVGTLQTNKVKQALALFDVIETLDRPKLARALAAEMERISRSIPCYIEINTGEEPNKAGVMPAEADDFIALCRNDLSLPVIGLMCIPPIHEEPALHFVLLAEIAKRHGLDRLSMGMSADFEVAIALGASHVRVGMSIFGKRPPQGKYKLY